MGKIKDTMKSIGEKLKKVPENSQGKAFVRILQFFAIMIVLTIFVKGASAVTMPKVTAQAPGQGEITNTLEATGSVVALDNVDLKIPKGITIKRILKSPGSEVKEGDKLLEYDVEAMKEYLLTQRSALKQLEIDLQALIDSPGINDDNVKAAQAVVDKALSTATKTDNAVIDAQNALNRAQENLKAAETAAANVVVDMAAVDAAFTQIKDNYIAAKNAYLKARSDWNDNTINISGDDPVLKQKYEDAYKAFLEAQTAFLVYFEDSNADASTGVISERTGARDSFTASYKANMQAHANEAVAAAQGVVATAKTALDAAKVEQSAARDVYNDAVKALDKAKKDYAEAQKGQGLVNEKNKLAIEMKRNEIQKQKEVIAQAEAAQSGSGYMVSDIKGIILDINVEEGQPAAEGARVRVSTGNEGFVVESKIPQADARQLKVGASVSVTQAGYYWGSEAKVLGKSIPDANGLVTVTASLQGNDWTQGDSVKLSLVLSSQMYGSTVPLTALHKDGQGDFVYTVAEESTILGTQMVAHKAYVTINEPKGKDIASIDFKEGGNYQSKVIITSSKPVKDGDWVRVEGK